MIIIIDYGMGNLRSVFNAFRFLGVDVSVTSNPADLKNGKGIVLPGVGAFGDGMDNLLKKGFAEALEKEVLHHGKPFLGLCLGMQLLATTGFEHGRCTGLNWIKGVVDKIAIPHDNAALRVPHIGWNDVVPKKESILYRGLDTLNSFYFLHSYALISENPEVVSGVCSYGHEFVASIEKDNIFGTQFHPEKSHKAGLAVLKNWCSRVARA